MCTIEIKRREVKKNRNENRKNVPQTYLQKYLSWKSQQQTKQNKMIRNKRKDGLPPTSAKFTIFSQTLYGI
jgi:hypothetical protein